MNRVILQLWEESERSIGSRPDGCSIHIDSESRLNYINSIYESRRFDKSIPNNYDKAVGDPIESFIDDGLFEKVLKEKSIRLIEPDLNNLLKLGELIIKEI